MKVYYCNDHNGHYIGGTSIVVASNKGHGKRLLDKKLIDREPLPSELMRTVEVIKPPEKKLSIIMNGLVLSGEGSQSEMIAKIVNRLELPPQPPCQEVCE